MTDDFDAERLLAFIDAGEEATRLGPEADYLRALVGRLCPGCGSARPDTPAVREATARIAAVYEYSPVGSNLHVYVDDFNLEGWHFDDDSDSRDLIRRNVHEATPEQLAGELATFDFLGAMTEAERYAAVGLCHHCQEARSRALHARWEANEAAQAEDRRRRRAEQDATNRARATTIRPPPGQRVLPSGLIVIEPPDDDPR